MSVDNREAISIKSFKECLGEKTTELICFVSLDYEGKLNISVRDLLIDADETPR